jgi:photosystem II stability/assembly factor-like uncharacterized protein
MKHIHSVLLLLSIVLCISRTDAQWVQTSGPEGGYVGALAADETYLYATTFGATFRMTLGDTSWITLPGLLSPLDVGASCLLVDGSVLVAGNGGAGVFTSTDHGLTWRRWITGLEGAAGGVGALARRGVNLLAGTNQGVYRSTDGGLNWSASNDGMQDQNVMTLLSTDSMIYAGTFEGGLFRARELGSTWTSCESSLPDKRVFALIEYGGAVYAGSWGQRTISRSTDHGESWQPMNAGLTTDAVNALTVMGTTMYAGSYGGVYRSTDAGATWERPLLHQPGIVNAFGVSSGDLYAGTLFDGVHLSSDGGSSWRVLHSGFLAMVINTVLRAGTTLYAGTPSALYRSDDGGDTWKDMRLADGPVLSLAWDGTHLFAGTGSNVLRTTDGGALWINADPVAGGRAVTSLAVMADGLGGSHLIAGTDSCGIYRSTDAGDSWAPLKAGLQDTVITCLAVRDTVLFAGTARGVFVTTLGSSTWEAAKDGLGDVLISCLATCGDTLFGGTHGMGVFRSTNAGETWAPADAGLTDLDVWSIAVSGTKVFAGTWFGGLFVSEDAGGHWTAHDENLRRTAVNCCVAGETDVFVGTRGAGVWRRPLSEMVTSVGDPSNGMPQQFELLQNYPNPFNPSTTITYELPTSSFVRLSVYDMLGREVSVLINERKNAGSYEVKFEGRNLASGVYLYRLIAGGFVQTRQMLVIK